MYLHCSQIILFMLIRYLMFFTKLFYNGSSSKVEITVPVKNCVNTKNRLELLTFRNRKFRMQKLFCCAHHYFSGFECSFYPPSCNKSRAPLPAVCRLLYACCWLGNGVKTAGREHLPALLLGPEVRW